MDDESIVALATAPLPSGIAILRVSGARTREVLARMFNGVEDPSADPKRLVLGAIINPENQEVLDRGFAVFMQAPNSYTGEDLAEFQVHGSLLVSEKILRAILSLGLRMAEPGEFTKRAFLNGKLDLVQAEAVADLISASSERALSVAAEQLEGRFSRAVEDIGEPLRDALSELEASIDFPEEGLNPESFLVLQSVLRKAEEEIQKLLSTYKYGHVVREGFRVLLCGETNAGKSTLFNRLLGKQRAIVTELSGTTRDVIEESALIEGFHFVICDSAGIRRTSDVVEQIGIELAIDRLEWADLVLTVVDAASSAGIDEILLSNLKEQKKPCWLLRNKIDLCPATVMPARTAASGCFLKTFELSALTGRGYNELATALANELRSGFPTVAESGGAIVTNERQRDCLIRAQRFLHAAGSERALELPVEIVSADIRSALAALEELVGKTWSEDLLGRIFSRFCIGK